MRKIANDQKEEEPVNSKISGLESLVSTLITVVFA